MRQEHRVWRLYGGWRTISSGLHLSASPGWQQPRKLMFWSSCGEQWAISSSLSAVCRLGHLPAWGLGSALFAWSERCFCFTLEQYSCFVCEVLGLLPCRGTGKWRLLLGLRGKTRLCCFLVSLSSSYCGNVFIIKISALWWFLRPSAIIHIFKMIINNLLSTFQMIRHKDFACPQKKKNLGS